MRKFLIKLISTFFFVGFIPFIPGTAASLAACFLVWSLRANTQIYLAVTFLILILGFLTASSAERQFRRKDAQAIVIDEVGGMLLCFLFLPIEPKIIFCGFILFRIFDALKVFPAGRLQHLTGGLGIMSDDLLAAFYTNIILQIVVRFAL